MQLKTPVDKAAASKTPTDKPATDKTPTGKTPTDKTPTGKTPTGTQPPADGTAQKLELHAAPAFKAADFYSVLKRPEQPGDAFGSNHGARRLVEFGAATAWLVPRDGAVCLVLEVKDQRVSGCRHKVADVRYPLVVALPAEPERIIAAAFPDAAKDISVRPVVNSGRSLNVLIIREGEQAKQLRWKISSPDPQRTETLPPGKAGFILHAREEAVP